MRSLIRGHRRDDEQAGFTLIEMLVVLGLTVVVATLCATAMVTTLRTTRQQQARNESDAQLRTAFERLTRTIREADPLVSASASSISVMSDVTTACTITTFTRDSAGILTQTAGRCGTIGVSSVLARGLATSAPLFQYFAAGSSAPMATPTAAAVRSVAIAMTAPQREQRAPTSLTSTVQLRNSSTT